jgi:hypothetical protein
MLDKVAWLGGSLALILFLSLISVDPFLHVQ